METHSVCCAKHSEYSNRMFGQNAE